MKTDYNYEYRLNISTVNRIQIRLVSAFMYGCIVGGIIVSRGVSPRQALSRCVNALELHGQDVAVSVEAKAGELEAFKAAFCA